MPGRQPLRVLEGGGLSNPFAGTAASVASSPSRPSRPSQWPLQGGGDPLGGEVRTIGRYALHAEVAAGGMAAIHIGRLLGPVGFARTVAIKRLYPPLAKDPEFVAMFLDEARLAARIRHPNVVSTLDIVATEGELFVVMDYVQGESFARLMRQARSKQEPIPQPIVAAIMVCVLHGLHAAHEARDEQGEPLRIVHRDVSPHNILVGVDGAAHLIDFGIAKARGRMQVTRDGQVKGKLSYMPPEQLLGQGLDHRADVFAASIVFWEALTGRRLFEGIDDGDIYARVLHGEVEAPSVYAKGLGSGVDSIVLRGLARDRNGRYPSAREMALAIEAVMPLATPSRVGAWVDSLAGDSIAERMEQIADIEGGTSAGDPGGATASSILDPIALSAAAAAAAEEPVRFTGARDGTPATQPGQAPLAPTRIDVAGGRLRASAAPPPMEAEDSLAAVEGVSEGSSRRWLVAALLLLVLAAAAAVRFKRMREDRATAATPPIVLPLPAVHGASAADPGQHTPAATGTEPPTVPFQSLPSAADTASLQVDQLPRASKSQPAPAGNVPPRPRTSGPAAAPASNEGSTAPEPTPPSGSGSPSCDPPYWFDSNGDKRYYRHCVGR
jgi:serine/threonine-protein kinase